jgi:fluoride exporter
MSNLAWLAFLIAAAIGAPARYLIDGLVTSRKLRRNGETDRTHGEFPWGTFVVNVSGSFVLGTITGLGLYHALGGTAQTVLGTGGMGAYTTFSTFTFESVRLAEEGALDQALRNVAASVVVCLAAASAGLALTALL